MKLLEFITYCTMKGIVKEHSELPSAGIKKLMPTTYYKLHIQARGYTVNIEYSRFKDWTGIVRAVIIDHGPSKAVTYNATLNKVIDAVMPNFDIASRIARSELS